MDSGDGFRLGATDFGLLRAFSPLGDEFGSKLAGKRPGNGRTLDQLRALPLESARKGQSSTSMPPTSPPTR